MRTVTLTRRLAAAEEKAGKAAPDAWTERQRAAMAELPAQDASRLSNVLSLVAKLIETSDLEQRMAAIEERLDQRETKR